ncbi:MAG: ral secretion pathway protein GspD [Herbaspirillum sp.]|nr:ral secretion pathway protein GspD [Herbaspirillum sp.]
MFAYRIYLPARYPSMPRFWRNCTIAGAILLLGGCAAEIAYNQGKGLVAQGRVEEGMAKFQEALARDPEELQYKVAYIQTRERAVNSYAEQGDRNASAGRPDAAESLYRRALALDSGNERSKAGLRALDAARRRELAEAQGKEDAANADRVAKAPVESTLAAAYKKPISIEFKDVSLKQVFEVISRSSGLNFLFDKDVRTDQKVTLFLKNSTIESAVYYTLLTNQLEQQVVNANTILIYPNTANKLKDYQEMVVHSFYLTNADAKMVANTLKTIIKSRDVVVDDKLNMLIVRDSPEAIRLAAKLVAMHDMPEPEVMLEVEILEVKRNLLFELGIAWPDSLSLTPLASAASGALTLDDLHHIRSSTLGATIGSTTINATKQNADANILANPRIRAHNHEKAKILIGDRVPLITTTSTATGFASESINYIDVGLKLDIEPSVHLDNDVTIKIALEVSNIVSQLQTKSGSVAYQIGTRTASTVLRLKDGENQVLAGLINDEDRRSSKKVPGLGDLPLIGRLFGTTADDHQKTEIVLSITPHLIRNIGRQEIDLSEFSSGTESSLRTRPEGMSQLAARSPLIMLAGSPSPQPILPDQPIPYNASSAPLSADSEQPSAAMSGSAQLRWDGAQQIKVGDTFTLQLSMQSGQPVTSLPLAITYDEKVLQASGVTEGSFLKQGGAQTIFNSKIDPGGQILITGTRTNKNGATGNGNFASINFRALAPADASAIQLLTAAPVGVGGSIIPAQAPAPHMVQVEP